MEIVCFSSPHEFRAWLATNYGNTAGIWLRIYKRGSEVATVTYAQALDEALCFGWIDGQRKPYDDQSWLQKFTPRRPKSGWSKRNTEHATRLIAAKRMAPPGLQEIKAAQADGRWCAAYDNFANAAVPSDFLEALGRNKKAKAFFATLNKTNIYSIVYRLHTAKKAETREKRIQAIIKMLEQGEKFH